MEDAFLLATPKLNDWTVDAFLQLREHGYMDNNEEMESMYTNPTYGREIGHLLSGTMTSSQQAVVSSYLQTHNYDVERNQSFPMKTIKEALQKICAPDTILQTIKSLFMKQDYYNNKSTYVDAADTILFVKWSIGDSMFTIDGSPNSEIKI